MEIREDEPEIGGEQLGLGDRIQSPRGSFLLLAGGCWKLRTCLKQNRLGALGKVRPVTFEVRAKLFAGRNDLYDYNFLNLFSYIYLKQ